MWMGMKKDGTIRFMTKAAEPGRMPVGGFFYGVSSVFI